MVWIVIVRCVVLIGCVVLVDRFAVVRMPATDVVVRSGVAGLVVKACVVMGFLLGWG